MNLPSPQLGFTPDVGRSVGLDKCVLTSVHRRSVMQRSLTALIAPVLRLLFYLQPLATTPDACTVFTVCLFPNVT